ncbi:hypothetical protein ACFL3Z_02820 [Gemmatimonadota bacterium]
MKRRVIPIYILLAAIGSAAHAQEKDLKPSQETELKSSEDSRIVVALDSLTRGDTPPEGMSLREPLVDQDIVVIHLTLAGVKNGHIGIPASPPRGVLIDSDGGEIEMATLNANITGGGGSRSGVFEILEGAWVRLVFVAPKASKPAVLRWIYAFWDSPENEQMETAQIEIDLEAGG